MKETQILEASLPWCEHENKLFFFRTFEKLNLEQKKLTWEKNVVDKLNMVYSAMSSVADQDPGSGFWCLFDPWTRIQDPESGLALKKPTQKTHPKKPKKNHLKKPTKNVFFFGFFWVFLIFFIFYENNTNFSLSNRFFMNK